MVVCVNSEGWTSVFPLGKIRALFYGEVSEWSNVRLSKSRVPQGTVGSNPTLSAFASPKPKGHRRVSRLQAEKGIEIKSMAKLRRDTVRCSRAKAGLVHHSHKGATAGTIGYLLNNIRIKNGFEL